MTQAEQDLADAYILGRAKDDAFESIDRVFKNGNLESIADGKWRVLTGHSLPGELKQLSTTYHMPAPEGGKDFVGLNYHYLYTNSKRERWRKLVVKGANSAASRGWGNEKEE